MKNYRTDTEKDLDIYNQIFKMNEVTKQLNLTPRTIRYYESEGLLGEVKRSIGYTRYFTTNDINRLKEIMLLKKKGHKISDIKALFLQKYPPQKASSDLRIAIHDTLVDSKDMSILLKNNIEIIESSITLNNVNLKYIDWQTLTITEYLKPFKISAQKVKKDSKKIYLNNRPTKKWLGNGAKTVVNYMSRNFDKININQQWVNESLEKTTEWLIMPLNVKSDYHFIDSVPGLFLIERKVNEVYEQAIVFEADIFKVLEKQIKTISMDVNGLLKQVTMHINSNSTNNKKFSKFISKIVPHKELLSIEELSPVYIQSAGSIDLILISMF